VILSTTLTGLVRPGDGAVEAAHLLYAAAGTVPAVVLSMCLIICLTRVVLVSPSGSR
jgi:hypothetical protein